MALKEQGNKQKSPRNADARLQDGKPLEQWEDKQKPVQIRLDHREL